MPLILLIHCLATLSMLAVIWFVQIVHYPLMLHAGTERFTAYMEQHRRRISYIVVPLMVIELGTGGWLVAGDVDYIRPFTAWLGLALLLAIWLTTFTIQVPLHRRLALGYDRAVLERLISTNWVRTILWSCRGVMLVVVMLDNG
ncbi:hypothetical protein GF420_00215 [candidate division GN15 bacterium]|nr:hypothetical protein [candidate division GN15 bacterium]